MDIMPTRIRIVRNAQPHVLHARHRRYARLVMWEIICRIRLVLPPVELDFMEIMEFVKSVPI